MPMRNIQSGCEIRHWRKQVNSNGRMTTHNVPLVIGKRPGLEQYFIGNGNFANIVQDGAAADMYKIWPTYTQTDSQPNSGVCHTTGMLFSPCVAEIQGARQPFNCGIICQIQLKVRSLYFLEH